MRRGCRRACSPSMPCMQHRRLRVHACFSGQMQRRVHKSNSYASLIKPNNTWRDCSVLPNVKNGLKRPANESAARGSVTWLLIQTVAYIHIHPMVQNVVCYNIQHLQVSQSECSPRIADVALVPDPDRPFTVIQWPRGVRGFDGVLRGFQRLGLSITNSKKSKKYKTCAYHHSM